MSSTPVFESLRASFAALKNSARCDGDVAKWFVENPTAIPAMPAEYHATAYLHHAQGRMYLDPNYDEPAIVNWLEVHVRAEIKTSEKEIISDDLFESITGQEIRTKRERVDKAAYVGEFMLPLMAENWPYVTADQAFSTLEQEIPAVMDWHILTVKYWPLHFPSVPWENVVSMYSAGILPQHKEGFVDWAMQQSLVKPSAAELPNNFPAI